MKIHNLSVVVPVFNEEGNITTLDREIKNVIAEIAETSEIIYINDGSTDATAEELGRLEKVTIINLNRNYGQAVALDAGFKHASGEVVVSLDGDGQNDPKDIPLLVKTLQEGNLDVVAGYRKSRQDSKGIKVLTRIGRMLRRLIIGDIVHDTGCTLRAYTKDAAKALDIGGEMHRYIIALLRWKGFSIGEVVVNDRLRLHGKSKYNMSKAIRGFIDLIYIWFINKFSGRPLHVFGYASMFSFASAAFAGCLTMYQKLFLSIGVSENGWFFISIFLFFTSILLFSFGITIDLLLRTLLTLSPFEKRYNIRSVVQK